MSDYFVFQSEDLFLSKFIAIGIIHTLLSFIVIQGSFSQSRQRVLFLPASFMARILPGLAHRLGASTVLGVLIAVLSSFSAVQLGPQTLLIVNAAFLTIWYVRKLFNLISIYGNVLKPIVVNVITLIVS